MTNATVDDKRPDEKAVEPHEVEPCYMPCEENLMGLARKHCKICAERIVSKRSGWKHR